MNKANNRYIAKSKESPSLLEYVIVNPPAIHDEKGTTTTGYEISVGPAAGRSIMYADLGVAFCEIAERRREFVGEAVVCAGTGEIYSTWSINAAFIW